MKKMILLLLACSCFFADAQKATYSIAAISEALKNKASVITHLEEIRYEVESMNMAQYRVHKIFTVMNEGGKDALLFHCDNTKTISLENAEVRVYDAAGRQTERYKKRDMVTQSVGEGLIEDGYVTYLRITPLAYPITVEVEYEQKIRSTLIIPDYRFMHAKEAVIESNYTAKVPADLNLRYKARHCAVDPEISEAGKFKIYKWSVKNLAPVEDEEGSVAERDKFPYVSIVADQFAHYGLRGDMSNWKNFGTWINDLYKGLDVLPADRQQFFQQLVKDAPGEKEKIARIYQYLQQNFRYVSIQLGIGGLQPFPAQFTDQKKYGDCKALSNYMKAALNTVGIKSYVAIINASYNQAPVDPGFPASDFNHVILCVPLVKDSVWLECTSNTAEFGRLGTFTENRNALLITENGGVLVPTPASTSAANTLSTRTAVRMNTDLTADAEVTMQTKGAFRDKITDMIKNNKDDQKKALVFTMGYKQPDYIELVAGNGEASGMAALKMELRQLPEFQAGKRYFIKPRLNQMWTAKLPGAANRKQDFYFPYPFEKKDTTIILLPAGFEPDVLPQEKSVSAAYGMYQSRSWYNKAEHAVYTATILTLKQHKILAADYESVKAFFDAVWQDDAQRIVVQKTADTPDHKAF
jgi:hypothetical protein